LKCIRTSLLALLLLASPAYAFNVGYTTIPTHTSYSQGGSSTLTNGSYTMPQCGILQSVSMWFAAGSAGVNYLGVYNDKGGVANRLLATTTSNSFVAGWSTFPTTTHPMVAKGTVIWLASLPIAAAVTNENDLGAGGGGTVNYDAAVDTVMPQTFPGIGGGGTFGSSQSGTYATFKPCGDLPARIK